MSQKWVFGWLVMTGKPEKPGSGTGVADNERESKSGCTGD